MSPLAENLRNALMSKNPKVHEAALRTLEELLPRIDDRELLLELHRVLSDATKSWSEPEREPIGTIITLIDSYVAAAA
ncbi:MAG: hypothetical protein FJ217_09980 [Ignavibacteria bacterium]|nr:hypothetical protein [Ignavibacteria bacterium]